MPKAVVYNHADFTAFVSVIAFLKRGTPSVLWLFIHRAPLHPEPKSPVSKYADSVDVASFPLLSFTPTRQ